MEIADKRAVLEMAGYVLSGDYRSGWAMFAPEKPGAMLEVYRNQETAIEVAWSHYNEVG